MGNLAKYRLPAVHRALNLTSVTIMGAVPPLAQ
jgi:hypothetical protein